MMREFLGKFTLIEFLVMQIALIMLEVHKI